jgi:CRP-like cAMP-binding protein
MASIMPYFAVLFIVCFFANIGLKLFLSQEVDHSLQVTYITLSMKTVLRKHFEELVALTDSEFDYIFKHFQVKKFKKHSIITQPGELMEHEYFVVKGLLKTSLEDEKGKEHILQFAMENWWVSDYQALHTQELTSFSIECLEDSELLCISSVNKNKLCLELHTFERFCRLKTTTGFLHLQKRIMLLLKSDAHARYLQLFEQYPALFQRVPKSLIASYLGVSRETLSRFSI